MANNAQQFVVTLRENRFNAIIDRAVPVPGPPASYFVNGSLVAVRAAVNLVAGANVIITGTDNAAAVPPMVDYVISSTGTPQTPWLSDIDAAQYKLTNINEIDFAYPSSGRTGYISCNPTGMNVAATSGTGLYLYGANGMEIQTPNTINFSAYIATGNAYTFAVTSLGYAVVITAAGQVGIRQPSPAYPLDVVGDVNITGVYRINGVPLAFGGTPGGSTGMIQFNSAGAFGGSANLFWDQANNRLGIGTATPAYPLSVAGDVNITGVYRVNGVPISTGGAAQTPWLTDIDGAGFKLKNAGNVGIGNSLAVLPNPGATDIRLVLGSTAASSPLAEINLIGNAGGAGLGLSSISAANYAITVADKRVAAINMGMEGTIDSGWIALYTWNAGAAAERMRITAAGNVGIGTTSPSTQLDVKSTTGACAITVETTTGTFAYTQYSVDSHAYQLSVGGSVSGQNQNLYIYDVTRSAVAFLITGTGNVGIGTTAPLAKLDVTSGSKPPSGIASATGSFRISSDPWLSAPTLLMGVGGSAEGAWIQSMQPGVATNILLLNAIGGNVGIGTTIPAAPLHIAGAGGADVPSGGVILSRYFPSTLDTRAAAIFEYYQTGTATDRLAFAVSALGTPYDIAKVQMVLTQDGRLGIGVTSPPEQLTLGGYGAIAMQTGNCNSYITHQYLSSIGYDCLSVASNYRRTELNAGNIFSTVLGTAEIQLLTFASPLRSAIQFRTGDVNSAPVVRMVIDYVGNVGIGVASPSQHFELCEVGQVMLGFYSSAGAGGNQRSRIAYDSGQALTNPGWIFQRLSDAGAFAANSVTITTNGRIGAGVLNPAYIIDAGGDINCTGTFRVNGVPIGTGGITTKTVPGRALGVVYQNTTGKWMFVSVTVSIGASSFCQLAAHTDNPPTLLVCAMTNSNASITATFTVQGWVGPGEFYKTIPGGGTTLTGWVEWY